MWKSLSEVDWTDLSTKAGVFLVGAAAFLAAVTRLVNVIADRLAAKVDKNHQETLAEIQTNRRELVTNTQITRQVANNTGTMIDPQKGDQAT